MIDLNLIVHFVGLNNTYKILGCMDLSTENRKILKKVKKTIDQVLMHEYNILCARD